MLAMRKGVVAAAVLAAAVLSSASYAQDQAPEAQQQQRRQRDQQRGPAMLEVINELELTPEQKAKIEPIREKLRSDLQAARDADQARRGELMRAAMQEARAALEGVLTPEQMAKLRELMQSRQGGQGPGAPMQRLQQAIQELDLTPEQKEKARELFASYRTKFQEAREAAGEDRAAAMEKNRAVMQEFMAELNALLTPEQREKLREQMPNMRGPGQREGGARHGEARPDRPRDRGQGEGQPREGGPRRNRDQAPTQPAQ